METTKATAKCSNCDRKDASLKRCAKCKSAAYCNKDCQKAHWKQHKKDCSRLAASQTSSSQHEGSVPKRSNAKPFTALYHGNFLHDRSEEETFKILIDVIRMRQEDTYVLGGDTMPGTIYNGERTSEKAFRQFLTRAKRIDGLLPPWWTDDKVEESVRYGLESDTFSLHAAQEKSDIQETWGDHYMPMKLRMIGEKVYGHTPGPRGQDGSAMLQMMMAREGDPGMGASWLDFEIRPR